MLAGKTRVETECKVNIMTKKMRHLMKFRKKKQEKKVGQIRAKTKVQLLASN